LHRHPLRMVIGVFAYTYLMVSVLFRPSFLSSPHLSPDDEFSSMVYRSVVFVEIVRLTRTVLNWDFSSVFWLTPPAPPVLFIRVCCQISHRRRRQFQSLSPPRFPWAQLFGFNIFGGPLLSGSNWCSPTLGNFCGSFRCLVFLCTVSTRISFFSSCVFP